LKISTDIRKNSDTILAQLNPASSEKAWVFQGFSIAFLSDYFSHNFLPELKLPLLKHGLKKRYGFAPEKCFWQFILKGNDFRKIEIFRIKKICKREAKTSCLQIFTLNRIPEI
jgi:hypothetical protein